MLPLCWKFYVNKDARQTKMSSWYYFCFETDTCWLEKMFNKWPEPAHQMLTMKHLTPPIEGFRFGRLGTPSPVGKLVGVISKQGIEAWIKELSHRAFIQCWLGRPGGVTIFTETRWAGSRVRFLFPFSRLWMKSPLSCKEKTWLLVHTHRIGKHRK